MDLSLSIFERQASVPEISGGEKKRTRETDSRPRLCRLSCSTSEIEWAKTFYGKFLAVAKRLAINLLLLMSLAGQAETKGRNEARANLECKSNWPHSDHGVSATSDCEDVSVCCDVFVFCEDVIAANRHLQDSCRDDDCNFNE